MARSVLRAVALAIGGLFLLGAVLSLIFGAAPAAFPLTIWGVLIVVGVAFERWRYKPTTPVAGPAFQPTAEKFIDPQSGEAVQVWIDPASGERRYVQR